MVLLGTVCEPLILHLMESLLMVPFLEPVAGGFHGVEVVADVSVAGEGFVGGKRINCVGAIDEARGSTSL